MLVPSCRVVDRARDALVSAGNPRGGQVVHQEARGLQGASELDKIRTCIDA